MTRPPNRRPFKGRPTLIIGAAVAALLVIGGTVFATTGDDGEVATAGKSDAVRPSGSDSSPDATVEDLNRGRWAGEAKVLWFKDAPDNVPGTGADALGMWVTGKSVVKAAYKQLLAFNITDGTPSWSPIVFPQKICAVTPEETSDGEIVVAYMSGGDDQAECDKLQQIDLDTGEKGWTAEVPDSMLALELTVTGETLMVGRSRSGTAYDITTGKKLFDRKSYGDGCSPAAFAGGARLIAVSSCDASGTDEHEEMQGLDPTTGEVRWTRKSEKGWRIERVYSVDPLVVYSTNDDDGAWNISAFKSDGTFRSQVRVDEDFAPECGVAVLTRDLQGCTGVTADADTLYLPVVDATGGAGEIVAIDLDTGKEKWRVKSPTGAAMLPLSVSAGQLTAYAEPSNESYGTGGRVVAISTTTHKTTTRLQLPQATADIEAGFSAKAFEWVDGRFYLSTKRVTGNAEPAEKLILAYGE